MVALSLNILTYTMGTKPMLSNIIVAMNQTLELKSGRQEVLKIQFLLLTNCPKLFFWEMAETGVLMASPGIIPCILSCPA